jgi:hypothetical protein
MDEAKSSLTVRNDFTQNSSKIQILAHMILRRVVW